MAQLQFMDNTPQFRQQQEYNFLQSLLMWLFNTIQEKLAVKKQYSRKQILYYQFLRKHSDKYIFYTLRFDCSFAAANTIKPQLL